MDPTEQANDNPFAEFSAVLLARTKASEICSRMHERHGLNVNLLLYCLWLGQTGQGRLNKREFLQAFVNIHRWHEKITAELHTLHNLLLHPIFDKHLQQMVSNEETVAWQIEQNLLYLHVHKTRLTKRGPQQRFADACVNIFNYLRLCHIYLTPDEYAEINGLLASAFPHLDKAKVTGLSQPIFEQHRSQQRSLPLH